MTRSLVNSEISVTWDYQLWSELMYIAVVVLFIIVIEALEPYILPHNCCE